MDQLENNPTGLNLGRMPSNLTLVERETRLELLIGHLSDLLAPSRDLVEALQLRSNASALSRGHLDHLVELAGSIWMRLGEIRDEAKSLRLHATSEDSGQPITRVCVKTQAGPSSEPHVVVARSLPSEPQPVRRVCVKLKP